jgi:hypothetical protein
MLSTRAVQLPGKIDGLSPWSPSFFVCKTHHCDEAVKVLLLKMNSVLYGFIESIMQAGGIWIVPHTHRN